MPWLAGELTKIALGTSDVEFDKRDQRFSDEAWRTVPYFRILGQSYRLFELWMNKMYESVDGSWQNKARARFATDVITAALSPTNYLATNPAALRKAIETGGLSLTAGAQNMPKDLARGGMPSMSTASNWCRQGPRRHPGRRRAPGGDVRAAAVHAQHAQGPGHSAADDPAADQPPLRHGPLAGRSLVEFAVSQGITVFMIVWRNPDCPVPREVGPGRLPGRDGTSQRGGQEDHAHREGKLPRAARRRHHSGVRARGTWPPSATSRPVRRPSSSPC